MLESTIKPKIEEREAVRKIEEKNNLKLSFSI